MPSLAVWKFASCDGCQLTLLDCEDELLELTGRIRIAHFREATSGADAGPYDVSLVEGSISTPPDLDRIRQIRQRSRVLVAIGACATAGGIQALRNLTDLAGSTSVVYPRPEYLSTLATATPIADHVAVDYQLSGCPIDRGQLLGLLNALLAGRAPALPRHSVCLECKARGTACLLVIGASGWSSQASDAAGSTAQPCLGPVTQAGCGAICPAYGRGCYGCFGPAESAKPAALEPALRAAGMTGAELGRVYRTFNLTAFAARERADDPSK
jgi:coenzyme F420-reducing hydrogenase gamma subunit